MKINVILALFGSATAIKVESTYTTMNFYMPVVMLHEYCPSTKSPKIYTPPPSTLKCDPRQGYYTQLIDVADGPCVYACNRQKVCTVENRCLPAPELHKACATSPSNWNPPKNLKCDSAKRQWVRYIESADGKSCEFGCNGLKFCTLENGCIKRPQLHKSCPATKYPKGFRWSPPKTLKCDYSKRQNPSYVEDADGKTCEWACNGQKDCTVENTCLNPPSLYLSCIPNQKDPKPPSTTLTCPAGQVVDFVQPSKGATSCKWGCNGYLPCVSGQPKTNTMGQAICDDSAPETPATGAAAAATIDATTLGAPAGTATVTYVFYETPNKTAATQ